MFMKTTQLGPNLPPDNGSIQFPKFRDSKNLRRWALSNILVMFIVIHNRRDLQVLTVE